MRNPLAGLACWQPAPAQHLRSCMPTQRQPPAHHARSRLGHSCVALPACLPCVAVCPAATRRRVPSESTPHCITVLPCCPASPLTAAARGLHGCVPATPTTRHASRLLTLHRPLLPPSLPCPALPCPAATRPRVPTTRQRVPTTRPRAPTTRRRVQSEWRRNPCPRCCAAACTQCIPSHAAACQGRVLALSGCCMCASPLASTSTQPWP